MSRSKKARRKATLPPPEAARPRFPGLAALLLAVAVAIGGLLWWITSRPAEAPTAAPAPAGDGATSPRPLPLAPATRQKLEGRWLRTDGGYVLEVRSVAPDGRMDAAYFNPRPIHVAKAEASREGEGASLFVELRDVNYPGSTYSLRYDPGRDILEGTYFQALQGQTFVVSFERR
jgi:hypothetical protein